MIMRTRSLLPLTAALLALLAGGGLLVGCAGNAGVSQAQPIDPDQPSTLLPNGRVPVDRVLSGGQPDAEQLAAIADLGYRTVVNLRTAGEPSPFSDERQAVEALGLRYVVIPVAGAAGLTDEAIDALSAVLDDDTAYPVVIHCASGNRVGALLALEAVKEGGKSPEDALELGLDAGLTRLEPVVREKLGLPVAKEGD